MADNERTYRIIFEADSLDDARQKAAALDSQIDAIAGSYRQAAAGQNVAVSRMDANLEEHFAKLEKQNRQLRILTDTTKSEMEKQAALVADRYDYEIEQAKGNARLVKLLEEQKTLAIKAANQEYLKQSSGIAANLQKISGALAAVGAVAGAAIVAKPLYDLGKAALNASAEYETLRVRLGIVYKDVVKGEGVFARFNQVAAKTPFSIQEIVDAGSDLKNFSVDAEKNIGVVADLAVFLNKSLSETAAAYAEAFKGGPGKAELFDKSGLLDLIKSKQGIDDLTKLTLPQFRDAMFKTFSDPSSGIAGATDKLSKTITGLESNLGDALDRMLANVGNRFAPGYKSTLAGLISITDSLGNAFASTVDRAKAFETLKIDTSAQISQLQGLTKTVADLGDPARLSAAEQEKLNATYQEIARIVPGAVTQVDAYGNALSVNLGVVNSYINAQQRLINTQQRITLGDLRDDLSSTADSYLELQRNIERTQGRIEALSLAKIEGQRQRAEQLGREFGIDFLPDDPKALNRFLDQQFAALGRMGPELEEARQELERLGAAFIEAYNKGDAIDVNKIQRGMTLAKEQFEAVRPAIDAYIRSLSNATDFGQAFNLDKLRQELGLTETKFNELVKVIESRKEALKVGGVESPEFNLNVSAQGIDEAQNQVENLLDALESGRPLFDLPPVTVPDVNLSSIQQQFNLTGQQVSALTVALKAYQEQLNKSTAEQVDANTKKQLEALQLQRRTLELQTNIALNEYEKQKAIVAERYASEIRQQQGNLEIIKELEAIKALEIEKINQKILSDATKRDAAIAAQGIEAFKRFKAELDKETQESLLTFEQIEIPPPPKPDPNVAAAYENLQGTIEKIGDVFGKTFSKWREGESIVRAFGATAKDVLEDIAATIIKNAAIYAIANILTGGSAGALTGGLNAGQFIFGNAFGGGGGNLTFSGGGPSSLNFSPSPQQNTPPPPGNTYNITIQAQDAVSFEQFLRERDGAKAIARTLPELI